MRYVYTKIIILLFLLFLIFFISLFIGPVYIPASRILDILLEEIFRINMHVKYSSYEIVVYLREPEILGAVIVGSSLGIGGAVVQSIFKNPITEPYIIGISSGSALGAVISLFLGLFSFVFLQGFSFIFSVMTVIFIYIISVRHGYSNILYLLLTGISVSFFLSSIMAFLLFSDIKIEDEAFFWLLGSLQGITYNNLIPVSIIVIFISIILYFYSNELDAIGIGERYAHSIGVNVERTKFISFILVGISVSAVVSISGLIGFVGLVTPHISRILFGGRNKYVIPVSAIISSIILISANDIAHIVVPGVVIPIGIITGIMGVPFFIYILNRISGERLAS
ncbi:FecCD family ABC transporter permease [Picrophilus oshimae]|uniref:Iron complex transport system permease protein n=1 Tax=Picrophilus torridus (strain ATCC 700027 / DSM 9790 / JCM 10055 / NBRC 100828 / KAW 2/3) TaxID=1122961 RepID=Q6KZE8_PICTO|nr:iron ABC transporter permease [Picrophilus oshimae]AAT43904.1 iron(III) dicitrate ABC transporter permease protein [Picrophilus oshimae DSM 9789]SMD31025.1 iron complex transport system permease protein [Picrophilus oshimae DSM 9789]